MWFTDAVDVPDDVVDALVEHDLVIFVGAGASVAPPSSLPLFNELARLVARDAHQPYDLKNDETPDAFLDRLERNGVSVHDLVQAQVGAAHSQPNKVHTAIVRLFAQADDLRIVTTNYDKHLSTAAQLEFGVSVPTYCGPALPLGRDFSGIVNIHGCVDGRASDLVVTSTDFGRAYLTDAWAARFLSEVFASYVTLFIGYSHKDVVMKYLAQGLRPGSRRFGFLADDQDAGEWSPLELVPILYPHSADHAALNEVLLAWSEWARMRLLDHESRVNLLVGKDPPIRPADVSYIERTITHDDNCRFFAQNAPRTRPWLDWVQHRGPFPTLFVPGAELSGAAAILAAWFDDCVQQIPDEALSIAQAHGGTLSDNLATRIANSLSHTAPEPKALGRWVGLLIGTTAPEPSTQMSVLLANSRWPDDRDVALSLFDHLTQPRVVLRPTFRTTPAPGASETEFRIDRLVGDDHWLRQSWSLFFRPHLDQLAEPAAAVLEHQLTSIHQTLRTVGQANDRWDSHSFLRSGIEPNEQDNLTSAVGFLVDCARDCLEHLLAHHSELGAALVARWERSEAPLLRRLAMHGWIERSDRSATEKMRHLLNAQGLFHYATKHEVYRLIETCLPDAHELEDEVLAAILAGPPERDSLEGDRLNERLVLDLLAWTAQVVPDSTALSEAFERFQTEHPDMRPSSHLGQDLWIEPGFRTPDSVADEDLLRCGTVAALQELLDASVESDAPSALMSAFQIPQLLASTSAESPSWAITLIEDLQAQKLYGSPYWEPLLSGLSRGIPTVDRPAAAGLVELLSEALREATATGEVGGLLPLVSEFLLAVVRLPSVERELLDLLEGAGLLVSQQVDSGPELPVMDHLERALDFGYNTWTGWAARFWVGAIGQRWGLDEDSWSGMSAVEKEGAELLLRSEGERLTSVQIIFAANYAIVLGADQSWCESHLLPLFDWGQSDTAKRAWAGLLQGGIWDERALRDVKPSMRDAFGVLREEVGKQLAERFGEVMVRSSADNRGDGTIGDFIARADIAMRVAFAESVGWWLHRMPDAFAEQSWSTWILEYLEDRVKGRPLPLEPEEAGAMLRWVTAAGDRFPQAVELYVRTTIAVDHVTFAFKDIEDGEIDEHHPRPLARLLNAVLAGTTTAWISCTDVDRLVARFLERLESGDRDTILGICTQALRLGCDAATGWSVAVHAKWPPPPKR
jgi:hypothetical protein